MNVRTSCQVQSPRSLPKKSLAARVLIATASGAVALVAVMKHRMTPGSVSVRPATLTTAASSPPRLRPDAPLSSPTPRIGSLEDTGPGRKYMDRYQGRSGRLPFAATTEERYAPQKIASADGSPVLVAWLSSRQVNRGEPASIYAAILDGEAVVERVQAVVRGAGRPPEMVSLEAGTGAFSAAANVDAFVPRNGGAAAVNVDVVAEGRKDGVSFHRTVSLALFVQEPVARLNARDAHVDRRAGDLVVRADAKITSPGTYFVYAELWTQGDEAVPVAFSRQRLPLSVGRQPIELLFGGQIIRDRGLDGPYEVRHLELSRVESVPPETAAPVPLVATTPAWGANEFN